MIPKKLLPSNCRYFVAGGFAACPALSDDTDVWVQTTIACMEQQRAEILKHLGEHFLSWQEEDETRSCDHYPGSSMAFDIRKVAKVEYGNRLFHILITDGSLRALLESFDISTHQVAITDDGQVVTGNLWTSTFEPPIRLMDTPTTLARLNKICGRYNISNPYEPEVADGEVV